MTQDYTKDRVFAELGEILGQECLQYFHSILTIKGQRIRACDIVKLIKLQPQTTWRNSTFLYLSLM